MRNAPLAAAGALSTTSSEDDASLAGLASLWFWYAATTAGGRRPRSPTTMPWSRAHWRITAVDAAVVISQVWLPVAPEAHAGSASRTPWGVIPQKEVGGRDTARQASYMRQMRRSADS
jgi:hypothetical protein